MSDENLSKDQIRSKISSGDYTITSKRKGKSVVWDIFGEIKKEDGTIVPNLVYCRKCQNLYSFSGKQTSNLLSHKCVKNLKQTNSTSTIKLNDEAKQNTLEICANWAIKDCRSFTSVSGNGYKEMANFFIKIGAEYGNRIDVNHLIPHPTTISRHVNVLAAQKRLMKTNELKELVKEGMAVTSDLWTDNYVRRTYLCATLHYIQNDRLCELALGLKSMDFEKCSGENIHRKLKDLLEQHEITDMKDIVFVTDRGSNMISALKDYTRLNCSNHLLQNILENAFTSVPEVNRLLTACNKLVKYFRKSKLQYMLDVTLKSYSTTRWDSHYNMFESIYANWIKISGILQEQNQTCRLLAINQLLLIQLIGLCKNFELVSKKLQGSQYVTLYYVYTTINFLKTCCQSNSEDLAEIAALKENILLNIERKWVSNLSVEHKVALFLHPPTNQLKMFDTEAVSNVHSYCINAMLSKISTQDSNQINVTQTDTQSSDAFLFSGLINNDIIMDDEQVIRNELRKYSNLKINLYDNFDVLKWWSEHKLEYENLYKLCTKIFCVPASSAPSERVFSKAGNIITEKRNRLCPETINNLIFLNSVDANEL